MTPEAARVLNDLRLAAKRIERLGLGNDPRVTEAPPLEVYRQPSGVTEAEIVAAYRRSSEARPCLCGGVVVADRLDPAEGVREHQSDPRHIAWREWQERE